MEGQTPLEMLGDIQQSYVAILGTMPDSEAFAPYRKLLDQNNRGFADFIRFMGDIVEPCSVIKEAHL